MKAIFIIVSVLVSVSALGQRPNKQWSRTYDLSEEFYFRGDTATGISNDISDTAKSKYKLYTEKASKEYSKKQNKKVSSPDGSIKIDSTGPNSIELTVPGAGGNRIISEYSVDLEDSTVTVLPDLIFVMNNVRDTATSTAFTFHTIPAGYHQKNIIIIDNTGILDTLLGEKTISVAVPPATPAGAILVSFVDVDSSVIQPPIIAPLYPATRVIYAGGDGNFTTHPQFVFNESLLKLYLGDMRLINKKNFGSDSILSTNSGGDIVLVPRSTFFPTWYETLQKGSNIGNVAITTTNGAVYTHTNSNFTFGNNYWQIAGDGFWFTKYAPDGSSTIVSNLNIGSGQLSYQGYNPATGWNTYIVASSSVPTSELSISNTSSGIDRFGFGVGYHADSNFVAPYFSNNISGGVRYYLPSVAPTTSGQVLTVKSVVGGNYGITDWQTPSAGITQSQFTDSLNERSYNVISKTTIQPEGEFSAKAGVCYFLQQPSVDDWSAKLIWEDGPPTIKDATVIQFITGAYDGIHTWQINSAYTGGLWGNYILPENSITTVRYSSANDVWYIESQITYPTP